MGQGRGGLDKESDKREAAKDWRQRGDRRVQTAESRTDTGGKSRRRETGREETHGESRCMERQRAAKSERGDGRPRATLERRGQGGERQRGLVETAEGDLRKRPHRRK